MALKYLTPLDMNWLEIQKLRVQQLGSAPSSPSEGWLYGNSTDHKIYYHNGTTWVDLTASGSSDPTMGGDISGTASAATVATVGGASAANIADAVTKRHTQGTDTGTTSATFDVLSGGSGVRLKAASTALTLRNIADNANADLTVKDMTVSGNLTVQGTTTTLNTDTMETGDNEIVLNSEITGNAGNTSGGIAIKRFHSDDSTRRDAKLTYNETSDVWEATGGPHTAAQITRQIARVYAANVGDNSSTSIAITHNLATYDVAVQVYLNSSTRDTVLCDVQRTSTSVVTLVFAVAPGTDAYRVVITG